MLGSVTTTSCVTRCYAGVGTVTDVNDGVPGIVEVVTDPIRQPWRRYLILINLPWRPSSPRAVINLKGNTFSARSCIASQSYFSVMFDPFFRLSSSPQCERSGQASNRNTEQASRLFLEGNQIGPWIIHDSITYPSFLIPSFFRLLRWEDDNAD